MAEERAQRIGVPLEQLLTAEEDMEREFTLAEKMIAGAFRKGQARFEKPAVTINDVEVLNTSPMKKPCTGLKNFSQTP